MVMSICSPCTQEVETGQPWYLLPGKPGQLGKLLSNEQPCLKKQGGQCMEDDIQS